MKVCCVLAYECLVLTSCTGGRYTPFMANYRPQCFIRTADITASLTFPEGTPDAAEKMVTYAFYYLLPLIKMQVMPGDNVEMICSLVFDVALEVGTRWVFFHS